MRVVSTFNLKERAGISRDREPIRIGIPLPLGEVTHLKSLKLYNDDIAQQCNIEQTAVWHDGSIKWLLIDFLCALSDYETKHYKLIVSDLPATHNSKRLMIIALDDGSYRINTGSAEFFVNNDPHDVFYVASNNGPNPTTNLRGGLILLDKDKNKKKPIIKNINIKNVNNQITTSLEIDGFFDMTGPGSHIDFQLIFTFYLISKTVKCDLSIHNKNAARHPDGTWDLGDPGSVYFSEIRFDLIFESILKIKYRQETGEEWRSIDGASHLMIYQESSGGINWKGNNHKNKHGIVPLNQKGYQVVKQGKVISTGSRSTPYINISNTDINLTCTVKQFWQNFPKALNIANNLVSVKIFPGEFPDLYELQAGERKSHTFYFDFAESRCALDWVVSPTIPVLSVDTYVAAKVFPYLTQSATDSRLMKLIKNGIEGKNNFITKREIIDEYGWRNYGDLYADHEAAGYKGEQPLVSHYNNQYDPIYGFALQFVTTGIPVWFEMMDDLAKHVTDIDIYHTYEDKHEFNGGPFWHTDHYLDASTCTHRTFSKNHNPESYQDYKKGGGPGNEHCYTSGLMYHYFLTGTETSKQAVLLLCDWMNKLHAKPNTILASFHKLIKKDIRIVKDSVLGTRALGYTYPLNRGTGNYINTLMDTYILTNDIKHIHLIENTIRNSIHPNDDIARRNLDDIEHNWSYTVYLQALCRYLRIKEEIDQKDTMYCYTQDAFIAYANWMLINEYFYLDKPEILEFPNQTWIAQEIRKVNIFAAAGYYAKTKKNDFYIKADEFFSYCINELERDESISFTRILSLLMQNFGVYDYYKNKSEQYYNPECSFNTYGKAPHHERMEILHGIVSDIFNAFKTSTLKNELHWISLRSHLFSKLYKKLYISYENTGNSK
jgi:hypothetical protein